MNNLVREDENTGVAVNQARLRGAAKRAPLGTATNALLNARERALKDAKQPAGGTNLPRAALGDVGNKVSLKAGAGLDYKNVKARVDCWQEKAVTKTTGPITRSLAAKQSMENLKVPVSQVPASRALLPPRHISSRTSSNVVSVRAKVSELPKCMSVPPQSANFVIHSRVSPKKSAKTEMTESFLTAHSSRMLAMVEDIDENDSNNPQLVSEYANDIYTYLYKIERDFPIRKNYLSEHKEATPKMRGILIDWINEVHLQFKLEVESYHLAVSIIDRYLQKNKDIERGKLQLLGVSALFHATKYEELFPPVLSDFAYICDDCYTTKEILDMEMKIFRALDFNLSKPLPIHFLRRFSKAAHSQDIHHNFAKYLLELASLDYDLAHYVPSEIAAAAMFLSIKVFPLAQRHAGASLEDVWTPTLIFYSRYQSIHLKPIVKRLAQLVSVAAESKLKAVYLKYSSSKFDAIAKNDAIKGDVVRNIITSP